jgi:hypothetical protein
MVCERPVPGSNPPTTTTIGEVNGTLHLVAGLDANGNPIQSNCQPSLDSKGNTVPAVLDGAPFCATVNTSPKPSPWTFTPKVGTAGNFATGEFYEGGIDLSFLGLQNECFASFLAETRSSQEANAVLKDFVLGSFQSCDATFATAPSSASVFPGATVHDTVTTLTVTGAANWTGTVDFFICTPSELTSGQCKAPAGTAKGSVSVNQSTPLASIVSDDFLVPSTVGTYCWRGVFTSSTTGVPSRTDDSTGECFTVQQVQPSLTSGQTWTVMDTATVAVTASNGLPQGGAISGTLNFKLFYNTGCTGTPQNGASGQDVSVSGDADDLSVTVSSNATTLTTSQPIIKWMLTYTSSNTAHKGIAGACGNENSTLAIDNGGTESTPPTP